MITNRFLTFSEIIIIIRIIITFIILKGCIAWKARAVHQRHWSSLSAELIRAFHDISSNNHHLFPQSSSAWSTTSSSKLPYLDHNACSERWVRNERICVSVTEDLTLRTEIKRSVSQSIGHRGKIWSPPQLPPCQPCKCQYPSNIKQLLPIHYRLQLLHISSKLNVSESISNQLACQIQQTATFVVAVFKNWGKKNFDESLIEFPAKRSQVASGCGSWLTLGGGARNVRFHRHTIRHIIQSRSSWGSVFKHIWICKTFPWLSSSQSKILTFALLLSQRRPPTFFQLDVVHHISRVHHLDVVGHLGVLSFSASPLVS